MRDAPILRSLGKYRLIAALGQGGMADVYLGVVAGPGDFYKLLVLKVLKEELRLTSQHSVDLFWDEARLAAQLAHPNVVHTYEVGTSEDGHAFLAMEYLEGQTYRALANRAAPDGLALSHALRILSETARGLHYAHQLDGFQGEPLGIVHRDVSPQNVFVTYDGQVKLLDFGVAKTRDADHKNELGLIKGKLDYIAPEQLRGETVDARADVFALGVMLWEAITRERFAGGRSVSDATKAQIRLRGDEAKLRWIRPYVPDALASIVDRALAFDPNERWRDAASFADAVDAYREALGERADAQTLSETMNTLFEEDRRRLRKVIEQQLSAIKNGTFGSGPAAELPQIRAPDGRSLTDALLQTPSGAQRALDEHAARDLVSMPQLAGFDRGAEPSEAATSWRPRRPYALRLAAGIVVATATAGAGFLLFPSPGREAPPQRKQTQASTALRPNTDEPGAATSGPRGEARAGARERKDNDTDQPRASTGAQLNGAEEPAVAAQSERQEVLGPRIQLALKVSPASARVSIDGTPVPPPFKHGFPKDATPHRIEAVAEGYRPYGRTLAFDRDHTLRVVLQRAAGSTAGANTASPARDDRRSARDTAERLEIRPQASPTPPSAAVAPGSELVTTRRRVGWAPIDTADPYTTDK